MVLTNNKIVWQILSIILIGLLLTFYLIYYLSSIFIVFVTGIILILISDKIMTLYHTILEKKDNDPKVSYTAKLLQGDQNSMLKKIVEEAGEFTFAVKDDDTEEIIYEAADLLYHSLIALASKNISPDRIKQEIARRFGMSGIEEKNSRTSH